MINYSQYFSVTPAAEKSDYPKLVIPIFDHLARDKIHLSITETNIRLACLNHTMNPLSISLVDKAKQLSQQGNTKQPLLRALGLQQSPHPNTTTFRVSDLTAGFGFDSLCVAMHGYPVISIEKNPITAAILNVLVHQYQHAATIEWEVVNQCSETWLKQTKQTLSHAIIDPFFQKKQTSLPKNDMQWLIKLSQHTQKSDEIELLSTAQTIIKHRIVVKRDRRAPPINHQKPNAGSIQQKTTRLDIYQLTRVSVNE